MRSGKQIGREFFKKARNPQPLFLHDASSSLYPFFGKDGLAMPSHISLTAIYHLIFPILPKKWERWGKVAE
jgi:hypothetical protein